MLLIWYVLMLCVRCTIAHVVLNELWKSSRVKYCYNVTIWQCVLILMTNSRAWHFAVYPALNKCCLWVSKLKPGSNAWATFVNNVWFIRKYLVWSGKKLTQYTAQFVFCRISTPQRKLFVLSTDIVVALCL